MQAQRILIAEDHTYALDGLVREAEQAGFAPADIFTTKTTENIVALLKKENIHFLILDIQFEHQNKGLHLLPILEKQFPALKVLVQTQLANDLVLGITVSNSPIVKGILSKTADFSEFQAALQGIKTGSRSFYTCKQTQAFLDEYERNKEFRLTEDDARLLYTYTICNYRLVEMAAKFAQEKPKQGDLDYWKERMKREFAKLRNKFEYTFNKKFSNEEMLNHLATKAAFLKYQLV